MLNLFSNKLIYLSVIVSITDALSLSTWVTISDPFSIIIPAVVFYYS